MGVLDGVSYLQEGQGEDLVFLHGYLACKESFAYQIACFSRFFRVTAFDFPGMGKSAPLSSPWSVGEYAAHARKVFAALGVGKAKLIAHSFGGRVALKLLSESPELLKAYRAVKKVAPRFAERKFGSPEYRTLSPVMRESYKKIVNEDLTPRLRGIRAPVLYVFGDKDTATPPYMAEILHENTAASGLVYMKGCSHFCFCERPNEFNAVAREFLL